MKKIQLYILLIIFCIPSIMKAQTASLEKLKNLSGDWIADGGGTIGAGGGSFSFELSLANKVMIRKSHSEYQSAGSKPSTVHDDLMVIYEPLKAIYFDNEGHVINYTITVSDDGKIIQLTSEPQAGTPLFRLTYSFSDNETLKVDFAISPGGSVDHLKTYVSGTAHRKK